MMTLTIIVGRHYWVTIVSNLKSARPCGATDNASDYGSEDSRFESWQGRFFPCFFLSILHVHVHLPDGWSLQDTVDDIFQILRTESL